MLHFPSEVLRTRRAHSLAELMIATAILAVILVAAIGLFISMLSSSTKTSNLTAGSYFARKRLEEIIRKDQYWPVPAVAVAGIYTTDKDSQTQFYHRVTTTPIPAKPPDYRQAFWIEVEVWWWSQTSAGANRAGQGRLSTRLGRLHYPPGALQ